MRIGFGTLFLSLLFHGVSSAPTNENPNWWEDLTLVIHRNGETDQCGTAIPKQSSFADIASSDNKYHFESALTNLVAEMMLDKSNCGTPDDANAPEGIFGFCDMGEKRTPVLLDHEKLVPVKDGSLPCSWYTREGVRISSLDALKSFVEKAKQSSSETCANPQDDVCEGDTAEFHLYGVQAGRVFMFAPACKFSMP